MHIEHKENLKTIRTSIERIDSKIIALLLERMEYSKQIGLIKKDLGLPICVKGIEKIKLASMPDELESIFKVIFDESKKIQGLL